MPPLYAVAPPPASSGWPSLVFWLACPFLVWAVLLSVVALAALLRAPGTEAVKVLSIFVSAFRYVATRSYRGDRPELDSSAGDREAGHWAAAAGDVGRKGSDS